MNTTLYEMIHILVEFSLIEPAADSMPNGALCVCTIQYVHLITGEIRARHGQTGKYPATKTRNNDDRDVIWSPEGHTENL